MKINTFTAEGLDDYARDSGSSQFFTSAAYQGAQKMGTEPFTLAAVRARAGRADYFANHHGWDQSDRYDRQNIVAHRDDKKHYDALAKMLGNQGSNIANFIKAQQNG